MQTEEVFSRHLSRFALLTVVTETETELWKNETKTVEKWNKNALKMKINIEKKFNYSLFSHDCK